MASDLAIEIVKIVGSFVAGGGATRLWSWWGERQKRRALAARLEAELLEATHDLQKRLYNFGKLDGWVYIDAQPEADDLVPSTLYRLARYMAYVQIWRRHRPVLTKVLGEKARKVLAQMEAISKSFLSDNAYTSQQLRLFDTNQDVLGDSMIRGEGEQVSCMGPSEFLTHMNDVTSAAIFSSLRQQLTALKQEIPAGYVDRLAHLQNQLVHVLDLLDPEHRRITTDREVLPMQEKKCVGQRRL